MDRKTLLTEILFHLDSALYLMDTAEATPDDEDVVWVAVNEAQSVAEERLNEILVAEMPEKNG